MFWLYPLLGAGAGALLKKDDPLKGALLGGALGAGGGLLAGGAGAAGAAGTAGAAEAGGGLLAGEAAAGAEGLNAAGYLAPEMTGTVAEQAAAPVVDMSTKAGAFDIANVNSGGLLGRSLDTANKFSKPAMAAMTAANLAKSLMPQDQPIQPAQLQRQPIDMSGMLNQSANQQQMEQAEQERRRQMMNQYMRGIR